MAVAFVPMSSPSFRRANGMVREVCSGFTIRASAGFYSAAESSTSLPSTTPEGRRIVLSSSSGDKLDICRVINGMWQTSGGWGKIETNAAVDAMLRHLDAGLNTFDLADIYGPAEDIFGAFINEVRRKRGDEAASDIRALTKLVPPPVKMTRAYVESCVDKSRKRMDVKSLDMLQFHWWDYANPGYLDALKHLTDLKEEGKIKTLALTNFDTKRLEIILDKQIPIVSNQVQHSLVDMRPQKHMKAVCEQTGVKLITYGTVMGGLLSEKFLDVNILIPYASPGIDTPSLKKYKQVVNSWGSWDLFQQLLKACKQVADKHGVNIPVVAVRYILDQACVGGSMVGVRLGISEHLKDSQAVFKLELDEDDRERIESVTRKGNDLTNVIGDCGDEYR